jgi:addiction module RelE/StbE family toxin
MLDEVIAMLAQGIALPAKNHDHALTGNYAGHRECHVAADWLLVYRIEEDVSLCENSINRHPEIAEGEAQDLKTAGQEIAGQARNDGLAHFHTA